MNAPPVIQDNPYQQSQQVGLQHQPLYPSPQFDFTFCYSGPPDSQIHPKGKEMYGEGTELEMKGGEASKRVKMCGELEPDVSKLKITAGLLNEEIENVRRDEMMLQKVNTVKARQIKSLLLSLSEQQQVVRQQEMKHKESQQKMKALRDDAARLDDDMGELQEILLATRQEIELIEQGRQSASFQAGVKEQTLLCIGKQMLQLKSEVHSQHVVLKSTDSTVVSIAQQNDEFIGEIGALRQQVFALETEIQALSQTVQATCELNLSKIIYLRQLRSELSDWEDSLSEIRSSIASMRFVASFLAEQNRRVEISLNSSLSEIIKEQSVLQNLKAKVCGCQQASGEVQAILNRKSQMKRLLQNLSHELTKTSLTHQGHQ